MHIRIVLFIMLRRVSINQFLLPKVSSFGAFVFLQGKRPLWELGIHVSLSIDNDGSSSPDRTRMHSFLRIPGRFDNVLLHVGTLLCM